MSSDSDQVEAGSINAAENSPAVELRLSVWKHVAAIGAVQVAFFGAVFARSDIVTGDDWRGNLFLGSLLIGPVLIAQLILVAALCKRAVMIVSPDGLRVTRSILPTVVVPWSEINAVYRIAGWPIADAKHLPWFYWLGLNLPLRCQLANRKATIARLRSLHDSRPMDAWPKAAKEFFAIYCR